MSVSTVRRPITFNRRAHGAIDETIVRQFLQTLREQRLQGSL